MTDTTDKLRQVMEAIREFDLHNRAIPLLQSIIDDMPCHAWKDHPAVQTTPVKCLLCDSEAVVIIHAPDGCTCSPNKYQPRCDQHLHRLMDTGEEFVIVEDFRIPKEPKP